MNRIISMNGKWHLDYLSDAPYTATEEPTVVPNSKSAVQCNVPGYWEDMDDLFRTTDIYRKLKWNDQHTHQRYPQGGYVPDMSLPNPIGCFVYQKTVNLDEEDLCSDMELFFGGVQNTVSAWANGIYIGRHEGYSTPFSLTVPDRVLQIGENRITLAVSNHRLKGYMERPVFGVTSRAVNECTGGIYGDVELRAHPDGLRDVWVSTSEDCNAFQIHIIGAETYAKTVRVYDGTKCVCEKMLPSGVTELWVSAEDYVLWSPSRPKLYRAVVSTERQEVSVRFGIRRLTADGMRLRLNGKPYFFRGTTEHCYQPITVHPTNEKGYYRAVIKKLKSLGFNSIRFHTWIPPREYMEAADELGMVIEVESPNNTTLEEWSEIVRFCRHHASVNLYSTGNELQIDVPYEKHLRECAKLVHGETDSLFSPMSAMRGVEYVFKDNEYVDEPFRHNPRRLAELDGFCDVYNSYCAGYTSYDSSLGTRSELERRNQIYQKPLLSHEICIHGTYIDLSLEERYQGTRIGQTEFMSSVRRHLRDKGLLDRANLYYRNSVAWQRILRKQCFELIRSCKTFSGYDFLGDIDGHWHTFGYCVGLMNEFYELKAGETEESVRRYNDDTVLLAELPSCVNLKTGSLVEIPISLSNFGEDIPNGKLRVRIVANDQTLIRKEIRVGAVSGGEVAELYRFAYRVPYFRNPTQLTLKVDFWGGNCECENEWKLYAFPKNTLPSKKIMQDQKMVVLNDGTAEEVLELLDGGNRVVLFGVGPFASSAVSWQLSVAGRTTGHLATAIADHPLMEAFPHDGYCGRQFESLMNESCSAILDAADSPHQPIVDIASSYKNAHREAMLFEYNIGKGKLLVCTFRFTEEDPAAVWLKKQILTYAASDEFCPEQTLSRKSFMEICHKDYEISDGNGNRAVNLNDITAVVG